MIDEAAITAWGTSVPWVTRSQVEQDLLLSRLILEIAAHPYLGKELVFRGGTCFHKLHLTSPRRYSEDLDYVRSTATGIGELTRALTDMGKALGFRVRTAVGTHPKVYFQTVAADGTPLRLKVEVNTYERSPVSPSELSATKIRALYQRKKGRDLFDLWLALTELGITGDAILKAFAPYRPSGLTRRTATDNLLRKLGNSEFREDLAPLVSDWPANYDIDTAGQLIIDEVHARL